MKAFSNWLKNIEKDYPKYQNKDGYTIGSKPALKAGWKAALDWIYFEIAAEPTYSRYNITKVLQKELEEE